MRGASNAPADAQQGIGTRVIPPLAGRATGPVIGLRHDGGAEAAKPLELAGVLRRET
jgi:hypothetical protein